MGKEKKDFGLGGILANLGRRILAILIFAAVCGGGMYAVATYLVEPKYESGIRLYINGGDTTDDLVDVCGAVLLSHNVLDEIAEVAGVEYTAAELQKMISYKDVNDTNMMEITVKSTDGVEAATIANIIASVLPGKAEDVIYESKISVLHFASHSDEPASPSVGKYTLVGMIIGIVLGALVVTWVYILDDAIKDREYLEKTFNIPVLAYIPEYSAGNTEEVKTETEEKK